LPEEPKIPRLTGTARASGLPLTAVDGFVLSRVDGKTTEPELVALTGLSAKQVRGALEKLVGLQVITLAPKADSKSSVRATAEPVAGPVGTPPPPPPPAPEAEGGAPKEPPTGVAPRIEAAIARVPREAPELSEDIDLAQPLRLRILATLEVLESLDYYELLNVDRKADKKTIKRSYFELASLFHPDRYFRKKIGSFKPRMEAIFGRVTQACDALTSAEQRVEYDTYLADLDRTRAIEDILRNAEEEAKRAEQDAQRAASRTSYTDVAVDAGTPGPSPGSDRAKAPSSGPPGAPSRPPPIGSTPPGPGATRISGFYSSNPAASPPPSSTPRPASGSPVVTDQARRDALAMRLLGNRAPSRGATTPPPRAPLNDAGLKRRYEERVAQSRKVQADKYVALAREAEKKNDLLGAATAYKVALGLLNESDPVVAIATASIAKAEATLIDTYLRQAQYEDRNSHWDEAAKSWQKVAKGKPDDARACERAANALVLSKGDLHVAAELAKRAIALEPNNPEYKVTLAQVYIEAGLGLNARRELEAAAQLSPRNANIQALLKRVNKAG
jgi:hypothetical protein